MTRCTFPVGFFHSQLHAGKSRRTQHPLNTVIKAAVYNPLGKALTVRKEGMFFTFRGRSINATKLRDVEHANQELHSWMEIINGTWESRTTLTPSFERRIQLTALQIYQALPATNFKECGCIMSSPDIKEIIKERCGQAASHVKSGGGGCCGSGSSACGAIDPITKGLHSSNETALLPEEAVPASLGCGNPTALAELNPGEVVLDLGSGGGIDVLLSARRVGPTGKATA